MSQRRSEGYVNKVTLIRMSEDLAPFHPRLIQQLAVSQVRRYNKRERTNIHGPFVHD